MPKNNKPQRGIAQHAYLLSLGIEMAAAMVVPILVGYYAESYYTSLNPFGIVIGALFGFISSFWLVYKRVILKK